MASGDHVCQANGAFSGGGRTHLALAHLSSRDQCSAEVVWMRRLRAGELRGAPDRRDDDDVRLRGRTGTPQATSMPPAPQPLGLTALTLRCNSQTFGTTCTASCLEGCHPKGSGAYTCGADGTWGGEGSLRCRGCPDNGR